MKNDVAARGSDNSAATGGDNQASNLSSQIWSSMIAEADSRSPDSTSYSPSSNSIDGSGGRIGFSSIPDRGSVDRTPPNTASDSVSRTEPPEKPQPVTNVGGDIRPDSMVDNQTLMERFSQRSINVNMAQLESPVVRMLSSEFHQQSQQMINNADNLPFDRIRMERATTELQQQATHDDMSTAEQRLLEASQRDPELQSMIPRMLRDIDNPRFHGNHGNDMDRLRQIAPDLAAEMDNRRLLGRHAEQLQGQVDDANTLLEKPTSTRFDYAINLVDSGVPENRDRAVQVLTELLNNNPDAARYRVPGSSGNRTMAELILRTNALQDKAFARAFDRAGGDPKTLMSQWREDRWSFIERPR